MTTYSRTLLLDAHYTLGQLISAYDAHTQNHPEDEPIAETLCVHNAARRAAAFIRAQLDADGERRVGSFDHRPPSDEVERRRGEALRARRAALAVVHSFPVPKAAPPKADADTSAKAEADCGAPDVNDDAPASLPATPDPFAVDEDDGELRFDAISPSRLPLKRFKP